MNNESKLTKMAFQNYKAAPLSSWLLGLATAILIAAILAVDLVAPLLCLLTFPLIILPIVFSGILQHIYLRQQGQLTIRGSLVSFGLYFTPIFRGTFRYLFSFLKSIILFIIVLIILLFVCKKLIHKNLKSLDLLSETVIQISQNQFDELVPFKGRKDEIGELQQSFAKMQQALKERIGEINQKSTMLKKQNEELNAAYERGQEDDRTKSAFLSQTTEKFMQPVNAIGAATDQLCKNYHSFSREEMKTLQALIIYNSDAVTSLIEQMLLTSQDKKPEHDNHPNSTSL